MMKKIYVIMLFLIFTTSSFADGHKGKIDLKGFIVGDNKFLTDNEGNFLTFTYDGVGGLMAVEGTTFMDNASQYCLGAGTIPGKGFEMGHCKINQMDGDTIFTYYEIPLGDSMNGTFKCLGGTGKYKGIECSGSTGYTPINSAQENKFASSIYFKGEYSLMK